MVDSREARTVLKPELLRMLMESYLECVLERIWLVRQMNKNTRQIPAAKWLIEECAEENKLPIPYLPELRLKGKSNG